MCIPFPTDVHVITVHLKYEISKPMFMSTAFNIIIWSTENKIILAHKFSHWDCYIFTTLKCVISSADIITGLAGFIPSMTTLNT